MSPILAVFQKMATISNNANGQHWRLTKFVYEKALRAHCKESKDNEKSEMREEAKFAVREYEYEHERRVMNVKRDF